MGEQIGVEVFNGAEPEMLTGYERFAALFGRKKGAPTKALVTLRQSLHEEIVNAALDATENFRQTIRRIYYLCSGLGMVPKGKQGEDIVNEALNDARWSGHLNWSRINDGGRDLIKPLHWVDADTFMKAVVPQFEMDKWAGQSTRVILAFEKDTLAGMLSEVCDEWQVPYVSFHGQSSNTVVNDLAALVASYPKGTRVTCLYLGDYDEAGLVIDGCVFGQEKLDADGKYLSDLTYLATVRDIEGGYEPYDKVADVVKTVCGKLRVMLLRFFEGVDIRKVEYRRIGITRDDIKNPDFDKFKLEAVEVKGDTQNKAYKPFLEKTGGDARTLGIDALTPDELIERTETAIKEYIDFTTWDARAAEIEIEREKL
jgi:hypothetical protein